MASKAVEDVHLFSLKRLLEQSGLECPRSPEHSTATTPSTEESVKIDAPETAEESSPEVCPEEEQAVTVSEVSVEEPPDIFPTPSLRKILPDYIRKIEDLNRIYVLPEEFLTDIDPEAIPKIGKTLPQKYIDILADLVGCKGYKSSLAEYWFLDTMANLLWRAQDDGLDRQTQVVLIKWYCEWMKEMQHFDAADRSRMLRRFQDNMLSAARFIVHEQYLPAPADAGVFYKAIDDKEKGKITPTNDSTNFASSPKAVATATVGTVAFEGFAYECSMLDLAKIIHYIYDLFSTDYQYDLIRSIFTTSPGHVQIEAPSQLQNPKKLYAPLKIKPKKETVKKEPKPGKGGKSAKKEPETEEFLALMELKAREQKEIDEALEIDREQWNLKSSILPLNLAADEDLCDRYWPPPPPEPEPEPQPEVKAPKKKK